MCCSNVPQDVKRFLSKHKNHKYVTVYKRMNLSNESIYGHIYSKSYSYKEGWNLSDSKRENVCLKRIDIGTGIHVYLKHVNSTYGGKVIKCKALISDLLAVDNTHAVFKKIYIPRGKLS